MIRGGYSIFYSGSAYGQIAAQMASQPPFAQTTTLSTSTLYPLTLQNGFPILASQTISNSFAIDPNYRLANAQNWVTAVQHTLPHNLLAEFEYIGTKGTHLGLVDQPNRAAPGASLLNAQNELPIAECGVIQLPDFRRQLQLQRGAGTADPTFQPRIVFHRALHLFEVD